MTSVAPTVQPLPPLPGTWFLVSGHAGKGTINAVPGANITAIFGVDGTVSGSAGCNRYVASFVATVSAITIGTPAVTHGTCDSPSGVMTQESLYLSALRGASTYLIQDEVLTISDSSGNTVLTFRRSEASAEPVPFAGIPWKLTSYKGNSGSMEQVIRTTNVTALLGADGTIRGTSGCNSFTGPYSSSGPNAIKIGPIASTLMYCSEPGVMDQETAYLALLQAVTSYEVTGDGTLQLRTAAGPVLVYSS
jgi:heat shock protein HslJ